MNNKGAIMKEYKGYNVPDVGEFVSDIDLRAYDHEAVADNYCDNALVDACLPEECKTCLFGEPSQEFQDWHNARLKGVKGENIR